MKVASCPGLAFGVFFLDSDTIESYHGYRDVEHQVPPDGDTIFNIGSMCKGFTALAIADLVAQKRVHWDDRINTFLDNLRGTPNGSLTIRDLLSHRSGLCRSDTLFVGSDNRLLLTKAQCTDVFASLDAGLPPRQGFLYNNFAYHAAGCIIEKVSSMAYGDFLAQRIFGPLNMKRTFTITPTMSDGNVAQAYVPYDDLRLRHVPSPQISKDTGWFSAGSIRSFLHDLVAFYKFLLRQLKEHEPMSALGDLDACGELRAILETTTPLPGLSTTLREQSYGMGWARTQLPNGISTVTGNSGLLDSYPVIGEANRAPLLLHHGGNNLGCSSTVYIFPELDCGIVVLGNALGHCDATDWAAQILTEVQLYCRVKTDFERIALAAASKAKCSMELVRKRLEEERHGNEPTDLEQYAGTFWHKTHHFCIVVRLVKSDCRQELKMSFQGLENETYVLRHLYEDTFVFNETFNEVVDRGQWPRPYWFYKIEFLRGNITTDALRWRIDDVQEEGQIFKKKV